VKAPPLTGGVEWLNTAGPLELRDLRGKFVLLDFWTYCCINCMHILPELKKLERAYPNEIVVIGVHSAKFDTEKDSQNIREAILRYEIEHPVVNDAHHAIWQRYQVTSWPSLRVIDPEGYLIAGDSGEVTFEVLDQFFKKAIPYYKRKGVLDLRPLHFRLEREKLKPTPLRFPGKVLADEKSRRLFIADSNHNRIVIATLEGKLLEVIGTGEQGARNGSYDQATFNHPQGMVLHGDVLYVADTENHLIRKVDLKNRHVSTVAGTGRQAMNPWPGLRFDRTGRPVLPRRYVGKPRSTPLNSPWALSGKTSSMAPCCRDSRMPWVSARLPSQAALPPTANGSTWPTAKAAPSAPCRSRPTRKCGPCWARRSCPTPDCSPSATWTVRWTKPGCNTRWEWPIAKASSTSPTRTTARSRSWT